MQPPREGEGESQTLTPNTLVLSAKPPLAPKGGNFAGTWARVTGV